MTKYVTKKLWEERYGKEQEVYDYAGRRMLKAACGNPNSSYQPTIDHVRPYACGGKDTRENIVLCNWETNEEKGDKFPHWRANGRLFCAVREGRGYRILEILRGEKHDCEAEKINIQYQP